MKLLLVTGMIVTLKDLNAFLDMRGQENWVHKVSS